MPAIANKLGVLHETVKNLTKGLRIHTVHVMTERFFQDKSRVVTRTQGCWNCLHYGSANAFWSVKRQQDLQIALNLAKVSPLGERSTKVANIKAMVDRTDHLVASRQVGICTNPKRPVDARNNEIKADLFQHTFLCSRWDGAQGASLAREGAKPDDLPEELVDKVDGSQPTPIDKFLQGSLLGRKTVS